MLIESDLARANVSRMEKQVEQMYSKYSSPVFASFAVKRWNSRSSWQFSQYAT